MKSEMLKERNSQFVLIHIWLFIYLQVLDSMKKIDLLFSVGRKLKLNNPCERCKTDHHSLYASCATDAIPWGMGFF